MSQSPCFRIYRGGDAFKNSGPIRSLLRKAALSNNQKSDRPAYDQEIVQPVRMLLNCNVQSLPNSARKRVCTAGDTLPVRSL